MHGSRKAKAPSEVSIKKAVNGGYIVRHSFDNYGAGESYQPSREHAFGNHGAMMKHVHATMSGASGTPATPDQKAAPSPKAGAMAAKRRSVGD